MAMSPYRDRNGVIFWWDPASGPPPIDAPSGSEVIAPIQSVLIPNPSTDPVAPIQSVLIPVPSTGPSPFSPATFPASVYRQYRQALPGAAQYYPDRAIAVTKAEEEAKAKAKANVLRQIGMGLLLTSPLWLTGLYLKFGR